MFARLMLLATLGLILLSGPALASSGVVYSGGSAKATHQIQIYLYLRPHHRAEWRAGIEGPCSQGSQMNRGIGTNVRPTEPLLRLRDGRFKLHRAKTVSISDLRYWYALRGHRTAHGFAGTLHYLEEDGIGFPNPQTCDSTILHWTARRGGTFP
jgi:hypothetical protein